MMRIRERCECGGEIEVEDDVRLANSEFSQYIDDWRSVHTGFGHSRPAASPAADDSTAARPVQQ